ncbi:hypothetical protein AK830_g4187 [Neonectria ditissima]|uniref:Uncharacterized protein n=1 Tax=Neonectria ditissima TaxID=78410 RepID=A0A0P7BNW4_9HYPO|nr:hypothetical protein AK830_g4187 [Neonectria ditissima]
MHHLCHALKTADWFKRGFRDAVKGHINDFYGILKNSNADAARVIDNHPAGETAEFPRRNYQDTVERCYHAAYYCLKQTTWDTMLSDPSAMLRKVEATVLSAPWLEHYLPTLINLRNQPDALSMQSRLGLFRGGVRVGELGSFYNRSSRDGIEKRRQRLSHPPEGGGTQQVHSRQRGCFTRGQYGLLD